MIDTGYPEAFVAQAPTLGECKKEENRYFFLPCDKGKFRFEHPSEFETGLNDVSRAKATAYLKHFGDAWLGNVNLHELYYGRKEEVMWRWDGESLIHNFEASFIIPRYDSVLYHLIMARFGTPYTGTTLDSKLIDGIFKRIEELRGEYLHWV